MEQLLIEIIFLKIIIMKLRHNYRKCPKLQMLDLQIHDFIFFYVLHNENKPIF